MRILLVHHNTRNTGDEAIVESTISQIKGVWPDAEIVLESANVYDSKMKFPNIKIVERLFSVTNIKHFQNIYSFQFVINNIPFFIKTLCAFIASQIFLRLTLKNFFYPVLSEYKKADMVLSLAGDSISMDYAWYFRFYEIYLLRKMNKKIILYAQSIGPFEGLSLKYAKKYLSMVDAIFARDRKTVSLMEEYGVKTAIYKTADVAIALEPKTNDTTDSVEMKYDTLDAVGFVIRTSKGNKYDMGEYEIYKKGMAELVKYALGKKQKVLFIASIPDDMKAAEDLTKENNFEIGVLRLYDYMPSEVKTILSKFKVVISPRMHPIILASTMGVPVIGIGKEFKMFDFLKMLGIGEYFVPMIPFDDKEIVRAFDKVVDNYAEIRNIIQENMKEAVSLSNKNAELIRGFAHENR